MAHKHDGTLYYIIIDECSKDALRDGWADILTFYTEEDAQDYIDDYGLENVHIEEWLDY